MKIGEAGGSAAAAPIPASTPLPIPAREEPNAFAKVLAGLGNEVDRGEALMKRAIHGGKTMDTGDLIALQAGVYRYSEAVDLTAKLIDRASGGVKTVIQGQ